GHRRHGPPPRGHRRVRRDVAVRDRHLGPRGPDLPPVRPLGHRHPDRRPAVRRLVERRPVHAPPPQRRDPLMGTPTIDVMVPSLWRPERLPGVAANIHEATASDHVVTFIAEHDDEPTIAAAKQLEDTDPGVRLVVNDRSRNYAGAINTAVATSQAEWWFAGADDLRFHHDWDAVALAEVALGDDGHPTQPVIGTNDLFNPYVRQ